MIEFVCQNCGKQKKENVLPGKHAVMGSIRSIEERSECCESPHYNSRGSRGGTVQKDLRDMATSRA